MPSKYTTFHDEWAELYLAGNSSVKIAQMYGCTHGVVLNALRLRGLTRSISEAKYQGSHVIRHANEIERLYIEGSTLDEVAEITGSHRAAIYRYLKMKGLMRNRSKANLLWSKRNQKNVDFFSVIDNQDKAYWIGFIAADGYVRIKGEGRTLYVELSSVDKEHLVKFANIFDRKIQERTRKQRSGYLSNMVYCTVCCASLCNDLMEKGIIPRKSYSDNLKTVMDHIPDGFMNHFVRGYFDGDGSIHFDKKKSAHLSFVSNYGFLERLRAEILRYVSVSCPVIKKMSRGNGIAHNLTWEGNNQAFKLAQWLYQDASIYLKRKRLIFEQRFNL